MADGATTKTTRLFLAKSMVSRAGGASLSELMEKCGVSRITVWRLLNELRAAGTPVDEEKRGERTFYMVPASSRGATGGSVSCAVWNMRPRRWRCMPL